MRKLLPAMLAVSLVPLTLVVACGSENNDSDADADSGDFNSSSGSSGASGSSGSSGSSGTSGTSGSSGGDADAGPITTFHVAMNFNGACAVFPEGRMKCWGAANTTVDNASLGDGPGEMGAALPFVTLDKRVVRVASDAQRGELCVIFEDGALRCWGGAFLGQPTGNEVALAKITTDIVLPAGRTAKDVVLGDGHGCVLLDDGKVTCWGSNSSGQLGLGDTANRDKPPVTTLDLGTGRTVKALASAFAFNCALLDDDRVKCWGFNDASNLANGDTANRGKAAGEMGDALPYAKLGTNPATSAPWKVKKITAGSTFACALLEDSSVKCWGSSSSVGALGAGNNAVYGSTIVDDAIPVVDVGTNPATSKGWKVVDIASTNASTCVLLENDAVKCWGTDNGFGVLGQGSDTIIGDGLGEMGDNLAAVALKPGRTPTALYAGGAAVCARVDTATLNCWGRNGFGVLGAGLPDVVPTRSVGDAPSELGAGLAETLLQ